jgi:hypothetical protein
MGPARLRRSVTAAAAWLLLLAGPSDAERYLSLEEFDREFGSETGRHDRSIAGFFAATRDFTHNAFQGRQGLVVEEVAADFRPFLDEARSATDAIPIPSGSTSVAYTFDPKLETFVRWERPLAPAISQNAHTNGRFVLTTGVSYSYLDFKYFNDYHRDRVVFSGTTFTNEDGSKVVDIGLFDFRLRQQVMTFVFQFGVTDALDLGISVPMIDLDFRGRSIDGEFFQDTDGSVTNSPNGELRFAKIADVDRSAFQREDFTGIQHFQSRTDFGDVVVRAKYFIGSAGPVDLGVLFATSLPTGDSDDLFGVGSVRFDPRLLVSTANERIALHVNGGYHADVDEGDRDRFDYSAGGEVRLTGWMSLLVDHVARIGLRGTPKQRKFEIVPGIKVNPVGDFVLGFNTIVPLNREGLTTDFTPNALVEGSFRF